MKVDLDSVPEYEQDLIGLLLFINFVLLWLIVNWKFAIGILASTLIFIVIYFKTQANQSRALLGILVLIFITSFISIFYGVFS